MSRQTSNLSGIDLAQTVCAIATPPGAGGLAIVRLSGPDATGLATQVFQPKAGGSLSEARGFTVHYGHLIEPGSGQVVDEVLATVFRHPNSFTGEDLVEFSTHGGQVIARRAIGILTDIGATLAAPGEFTLRAFLNGRIDLTQAEAIAEIVNSKTEESAAAAMHQLGGHLKEEIAALRAELISALAHLEMGIDFTEEDLDPADITSVRECLARVARRITRLKKGYRRGQILRDGFVVVLAGPPNVGKSTLFNLLAQDDRAIVTDIPGTTRDILREYINLEGYPLCLVDTAGIHEATGLIERIGMERSGAAIHSADAAVWMIDATQPWSMQTPPESFAQLKAPWLVCINKVDLSGDDCGFADQIRADISDQKPIIPISALQRTGTESLLTQIKDWIAKTGISGHQAAITINDRHLAALARAETAIAHAIAALTGGAGSTELAAFDAKSAAESLGEIIGLTTTDEILGNIFSNFCVGK